MYSLPYYKEPDENVIREFVKQHPFAFLSGCDADLKPVATQVPVFLEERDDQYVLSGHIMRKTDHHKAFLQNNQVLAVFTGPHTYVSATWYSNPHLASTWNYMSVHARGRIRFLDEAGLVEMLRKTTLHFEGYNRQSSTVYDNLPPEYVQKIMKAIVAFEIEVTDLDHVFKLSQDRDVESYQNIMDKLRAAGGDSQAIAEEMEKRRAGLFSDDDEKSGGPD